MKIVVLCKREPQGRDLWQRPYGRFYHLAKGLAERGHEVHLVLLSYRRREQFEQDRDGIHWRSVNLLPDPSRYFRVVRSLAREIKAEWIIGFSDTFFGICAQRVASELGVKSLIDAYDNYESYIPWALPLHWLWRSALSRATAVSAAGPGLLDRMTVNRRDGRNIVIEMAADPSFVPGSKAEARAILNLPQERKLVSYCGSLHHSRGVELLLAAMDQLSVSQPDVGWVFSGRNLSGTKLPETCYSLGYVSDDRVVYVLRSSDLMLAVNIDNAFGNYSYPVKIYEAKAVGTQVISLKTASTEFVMRDIPEGLVRQGNATELAKRMSDMLDSPVVIEPKRSGWEKSIEYLDSCLREN